jgi:hypothetical protein
MTEEERIDRQLLLRRAAGLLGAAYVAPVVTSSASAETAACAGQACKPGKKGKKKCKKAGGKSCMCLYGMCTLGGCMNHFCFRQGPRCGSLEPCEAGNCGCFLHPREQPGGCIELLDGLCETYQAIGTCPDGTSGECPASHCCFSSCCQDFGYTFLCAPVCSGNSVAPAWRSPGGAGSLYTSLP